jgi:hypothetical protein
MKLTRALFVVAFAASSFFANAATFVSVECTQVNSSTFHLSCKAGEGEVAGALINYDVKNTEGKVLASGYGTNVAFDETKLSKGEEYSITVYALVNGAVESQTVVRHAGVK